MRKFSNYLLVQSKRTAKAYIGILALTMVLFAVIGSMGVLIISQSNRKSMKKLELGIVGDSSDRLFNVGLALVDKIDSSSLSVELVELDSEKEAVTAMKSNRIEAYVVIPKNFAASLMYGDNKKLRYVMAKGTSNMGVQLSQDVIEVISNYVIETQAGVSAMCDYAADKSLSGDGIDALNIDMSVEYLSLIASRQDFAEIETVGLGGNLSTFGYYICGLTVFFLLSFGMACCTLRIKNNWVLPKFLYSKGYGVVTQIMGEFIPYVAIMLITLLIPCFLLGCASYFVGFNVQEVRYWIMSDYISLPFKIIPAVICIAALQFMLYELVSGAVNSVFIQLVAAVVLGYISGCFYPIYFFPEAVQRLAAILPTGVAINYIKGVLTYTPVTDSLALLAAITLVMLAVTAVARNMRINASEG